MRKCHNSHAAKMNMLNDEDDFEDMVAQIVQRANSGFGYDENDNESGVGQRPRKRNESCDFNGAA